jgi:hypothetical protein
MAKIKKAQAHPKSEGGILRERGREHLVLANKGIEG